MSDPSASAPLLPRRYAAAAAAVLAALTGLGLVRAHAGGGVTEVFLVEQDLLPAFALAAFWIVLALVRLPAAARAGPGVASETGRPGVALALAAGVALVGWAGARLVFGGYTVAADETMARFDAAILAHGRLMAPVAPALRPFELAMAPSFLKTAGHGAGWSSSYLPVNAALQALAARAGDADLASALLGAAGVIATWAVGRRLWPERPARAWIAAGLVATSPQVTVAAMTPYAMSAHLAFDMTWLWLFLGPSRRSQIAAAGVAFLATGLHQLLFHPLFAAPFVLELWLSRRWRRAAFHTGVYAACGLFWAAWPGLAERLAGLDPTAGPHVEALATLMRLLAAFQPEGVLTMAENGVRFVTWASPPTLPLWLAGAVAAWRMRGVERALAGGPLLTVAAMLVLLPYQGHGWGYRYLHGEIGAIALTAALGFTALLDRFGPERRRAPWAGLGLGLAAGALVLLPLRAAQAKAWAAPYAAALRLASSAPTEVVVIDSDGLFFAWDVVRNDPFLARRPKLMALELLSDAQLDALCARGAVTVLDAGDLAPLGVPRAPTDEEGAEHDRDARARLQAAACEVRPDGRGGFTRAATPR